MIREWMGKWTKGHKCVLAPSPFHQESRIHHVKGAEGLDGADVPLWSLVFPFSALTRPSPVYARKFLYMYLLRLISFQGFWSSPTQSHASGLIMKAFMWYISDALAVLYLLVSLTQIHCSKGKSNLLFYCWLFSAQPCSWPFRYTINVFDCLNTTPHSWEWVLSSGIYDKGELEWQVNLRADVCSV